MTTSTTSTIAARIVNPEELVLRHLIPRDGDVFITPGRPQWAAIVSAIILIPVTTLFLATRIWLQRKKRRSWLVPDTICLMAALMCFYALCGLRITNSFTGTYKTGIPRPDPAVILANKVRKKALRNGGSIHSIHCIIGDLFICMLHPGIVGNGRLWTGQHLPMRLSQFSIYTYWKAMD